MTHAARTDDNLVLEFGPFRLIPATRQLFCHDRCVKLGSRARAILLELADNPGQLVTHADLLRRVWPVTNVSTGTVRVHIAALRRTLMQFAGDCDCIQSIHGHGYRFVTPVRRVGAERSACRTADWLPALLQRLEDSARLIDSTRAALLDVVQTLEPRQRDGASNIEMIG